MKRHVTRKQAPYLRGPSKSWAIAIVAAILPVSKNAWAQVHNPSGEVRSAQLPEKNGNSDAAAAAKASAKATATAAEAAAKNSRVFKALANLAEAKRLIVDAFPEDRDSAEALIISATRIAPELPEPFADLARFTLWQIANGMKDTLELHKASQLATHVRDLAPNRPLGDFLIAEILLALGQQQQAMTLFTQASAKYPDHIDTKIFEARFYSESNPRRSLESAQIALAAGHPMDDLSPALALALTNVSKGSAAGHSAGTAIERFAEIYPDRWLWHRAGAAFMEEREIPKARLAFQKAIALGNVMESRLQLGIMEYTIAQEPKKALQEFLALNKLLESRDTSRHEGRALVTSHAALAALSDNNLKLAAEFGNKALVLGATNSNVVGTVVEEFKRKNKADLLWPGLVTAAKENPFLDYAHVSLGVLATDRKDYAAAQDYFGNALALSPERDDLYSARGHAAYLALNYDSALRDFDSALKIRPEQSSYHYNKSCMLALLGRKKESMASLKTAVLMNRDLLEVASRDVDLQSLRTDRGLENQLANLGVIPRTPGMKPSESEKEDDDSALAVDYSTTKSTTPDESLE